MRLSVPVTPTRVELAVDQGAASLVLSEPCQYLRHVISGGEVNSCEERGCDPTTQLPLPLPVRCEIDHAFT